MFTAITKSGQIISLLSRPHDPFLVDDKSPFFCPACSERVVLKKGTIRRWHFAHQNKTNCFSQSEPETEEHLHGKSVLYEWLTTKGFSPILEAFLPSINRKADLLFTWKTQTFALEFQCSSISTEEALQRSSDYLSIEVMPIWIYSLQRLRQKGKGRFSVQSFEWTGLRERNIDSRHALIYLCPAAASFYYLFPRAMPSASFLYADVYSLPVFDSPVEHIVNLPPTVNGPVVWNSDWLHQKKTWRFSSSQWRGKPDKTYIRQVFAGYRSDLPFFPAEAGWPILSMEIFRTPPYIWQSWLLLCFLPKLPLYQRFSLRMVIEALEPLLYDNTFMIRDLPFLSSPIEKAVYFYLELLKHIGILTNTGSGWKKINNIILPLSLEDAFHMDKKWSSNIFYKGTLD
ncbi:competence protein CoiA [Alteribacillus sp. JSM 102045]|uniref:competence protein CoiA n=1 Tax=Alteribacillus sp. JSM 102045 TaxID=1562101 RepID=UPI0035C0894D